MFRRNILSPSNWDEDGGSMFLRNGGSEDVGSIFLRNVGSELGNVHMALRPRRITSRI
jgi:hypothetical protein